MTEKILVHNANGDPDTTAKILIQNKIGYTPKVSVIIPVYNTAEYLPQCLDSVVNQTLQEIEIICVDDGSTDSSLEILREYAKKDNRITVITQENLHAGVARNAGFTVAKGEYVYFMDSDDLCSEFLLAKTVELADKNKADIVAFNGVKFFEDGTEIDRTEINPKRINKKNNVFNYKDCPKNILQTINPTPWNKLFNASFIRNNNLYFEPISTQNDITFAAVALARAKRISYTTEKFYRYRWGQAGTITSTKAKNIMNIVKALESAEAQIKKLPYFNKIKISLYRFIIDNYIYGLENNCPDFNADVVKPFYDAIHKKFNTSEFISLSEDLIGDKLKYYKFLILKNNTYECIQKLRNKKLIVSLTTYPARIDGIHFVLTAIINQTYKADKIILCLVRSEFENSGKNLPKTLLTLVDSKQVEIHWYDDNLRPHNKYFYAFHKYPKDLVVTVDDDILYDNKLLESLYISYLLHPDCISTLRTHLMLFNKDGSIKSYNDWVHSYDYCLNIPSMALLATGVGGCLYPVELMKSEYYNKELISHLCLAADDLWLKMIEVMNNIPVVNCYPARKLRYIPETQETALWKSNVTENKNDIFMKNILEYIDASHGSMFLEHKIKNDKNYKNFIRKYFFLTSKYFYLVKKLVKKFKGGLRCIKQHGFIYTVKLFCKKVRKKIKRLL
ncbi:MAG: glycosyltransferase [Spirochaetia bacterium]|nr:glycosyltransferase [Spirochaetia bacterium]